MDEKIFYLTKAKLEEIKKEYESLAAFERDEFSGQEAPKMFESDNLNPEFVSFQENIEQVRSRMDLLKAMIDHHEIIRKPPKSRQHMVDVGATVTVGAGNARHQFTIVGTVEADPTLGKISNESPVGKALLGLKTGDHVTLASLPKKNYKITQVNYQIG
jgi:transcription elongation factor GreA